MIDPEREIYEFDGFRLDVAERRLTLNDLESTITPKAFDLLVLLVRESGHLLTKDRIIDELWPGSFVEEANLNVNISALRRVLGDTAAEQRFIETVPRQGYRFVGEVRRVTQPEAVEPSAVELTPSTSVGDEILAKVRRSNRRRSMFVVAAGAGVMLSLLAVWFGYRSLGSVDARPRSIAVLPFRSLAQTTSDEALEMGMTDALITKLGKIQQLSVRPTSAVRKFASQYADALDAGRELRVEAVLDGKVQRDGNKVRVSVQLLRVADGMTLWSESFDDFFTNIFAVQDSISERMAASLAVKLSPHEQESIEKRYTESTEAYQLYLQAQHHHLQITAEGSRNAVKYYEQAVKVDPKYAMAWAASVGAYAHIANLSENREANLQKARIAAYTSLSLDPELPEAHEAVATVLDFFDWNWDEAEREYKKAIELGPNRDGPHYAYSIFLSRFKRHDEAVREIRTAAQVLPDAVFVQNQIVQTLYRARRFEECIAEANRSLEMKHDGRIPLSFLFRTYLQTSKLPEAETAMNRLIEVSPNDANSLRARLYLKTGRKAEADAIIRPLVKEYKEGDTAWLLAQHHLRLEEFDRVFEMLEHSFRRREANLTMINVEPEWDPIRGDPRYTDLMRRIGIPP
jgi:DNA-binding winged helix-turn-helix (wHTH) protein/TolB-like protein/Flp pilus assembly protein TadD